jgi:hypothetical protein
MNDFRKLPEDLTRETLLLEEIKRIVEDARKDGGTLRAGYQAGLLAVAHPNVFSIGRIVDELVMQASKRKVPVEISRPDQ